MKIRGAVWTFGDNINTDEIIAARYLSTFDEKELGAHCMEDIELEFPRRLRPGDIIVAKRNFGCGSSREHAPIAIKGCGIACVVAVEFCAYFLSQRDQYRLANPRQPGSGARGAEGRFD